MRITMRMVETVMATKTKKRAVNLSLTGETVAGLAGLAKKSGSSMSGTVEVLVAGAQKTATARSRKGVA